MRAVLLGYPLGHSRLAPIMNAAFAAAGLDWEYGLLPVSAEQFDARVRSLAEKGYVGANVTMPHKLAARAIADECSPAATAIGAVNTLVFRNGRITGENTDAGGILDALGISPRGYRVLVLGAGGAARAAAWALLDAGASQVSVWNRTYERADALAADVGARVARRPDAADLLINATSVGVDRTTTVSDAVASLQLAHLEPPSIVLDLVYGPSRTPVCEWGRRGGARTIDGLEVLICQGARSFRCWAGRDAPMAAMREAAQHIWTTHADPSPR